MESDSEAGDEYDGNVGNNEKGDDALIGELFESSGEELGLPITPRSRPMSIDYNPRSISTSRTTINIGSSSDNSLLSSRPITPLYEVRGAQRVPPSSEDLPQPFDSLGPLHNDRPNQSAPQLLAITCDSEELGDGPGVDKVSPHTVDLSSD